MNMFKTSQFLVWIIPALLASHASMAQKKVNDKMARPSWIAMMDDPNVNYFKAVDAFNDYWKNREKPVEEDEMFESAEDKEKEVALEIKKKKLAEQDPAKLYAFEYKHFLWWMRQVEPFVQADGRIKSMDERINEWKIQKQQKDAQKSKTKNISNYPKKN